MIFLRYIFIFTVWEMAVTTSHERSVLKILKSKEVLIHT